ncbi:hypothetical protein FGO68_gene1735 [Halteria grandinella]|uniref:Next to BRCA1 central domain-containing protein n=1 Tax=Halteria grandinella TaxID=5974 RepID=A0A8J8NPT5_HALGN|nr:hypothetical protein FGO68_gene1735 [Halteria grandinella]
MMNQSIIRLRVTLPPTEHLCLIENPSKDLQCLANQIRKQLKDLSNFTLNTSANSVEELQEREFTLQWLQYVFEGEERIVVQDSDQLEEIYNYTKVKKGGSQLITFEVLRRKEDIQNNNPFSEYKSCMPSNNLQPSDEKQQPHILDDLASEKSEEFVEVLSSEEEEDSSSSEDEEREEREMLQYLRHKIRLEVEKNVFALIETEPELHQIKEHIQELQKEEVDASRKEAIIEDFIKRSPEVKKEKEEQKSEDEEEYFDVEGEEEKIEHSQHIDVYVSMKDANKPEPLNQSQVMNQSSYQRPSSILGQSLKQSVTEKLTSFKNFFQKKQIPLDKQQYCMVLGDQPEQYIEDAPTNNYCTIKWQVQNQAKVQWPQGAQLVLVYSHPVALVEPQELKCVVKSGDKHDIIVNIFLPKNIAESHQIVMFRIRDKKEYIGQPLIAFIKIDKDTLNRSSLRESVLLKHGQPEFSDEKLLSMASILVDEGYGSFDRCYALVRALRGDIGKARETMSQLIFYECGL